MTIAGRVSIGISVAVIGLVLLLWAAITFQATAEDALTLEGDNVITYDHAEPLTNATRKIVQGIASEDGCSFSLSDETDADFIGDIIQREAAFDPDSCQSLIEESVIPAEPVHPIHLSTYPTKYAEWTRWCTKTHLTSLSHETSPIYAGATIPARTGSPTSAGPTASPISL